MFDGKTVAGVCTHHLHSKPESPSARLGARVASEEEVILGRVEKNPVNRYANAEALAQAFARPELTAVSRRRGLVAIDLSGRGPTTEEGA